ncbi:MAG TPA: M20/M25/M40 family metallo-hydrolase [Solirubrobacteraceae bacterium]|nr:M20/M25/M40 family metallo-hydrolase [Solirubrobacteraceae bacterium]
MAVASEVERRRCQDTFAALCRIPSPPGQEGACARYVTAQLEALGVTVAEDRSQAETEAECGNLLARLPGTGEGWLLLCAHLDTVALTAEVEPVIVDGAWENAHPGVLGADNKAAVAVLLEAAHRWVAHPPPVGIELLFTVSEEIGLVGAKAFDAAQLHSRLGYVFDHASPIGEVVLASPTYYRVEARFRGAAAHAGIRPEQGRSAIVAAARAVTALPHGRLDPETTVNVGTIEGGDGATNVVPEHCRLLAEARGLDGQRVEAVVAEMVDHIHDAANHSDCACDVDVVVQRMFEGYRTRPSAPAVAAAETALRACGFEPRHIVTGGGSDANALQSAGLSVVNLANGTERNHQPDERVSLAAVEAMLDVTLALPDAVLGVGAAC